MRRLAIGALALLAACDDGTVISHVDKDETIEINDLVTFQRDGAIPTEVHGAPFSRASAKDVARFLRPPSGAAQGIRWRAIEVGSDPHGYRMVLHFNPSAPPNAAADCKRFRPAVTMRPQEVGFSVNLSICDGERARAHGYLQARKTEDGDYQDFTRVMRALMNNIFTEARHDR
ncbi:MAG: hypothetical protein AAGF44_04605 [Pseudomonadota bacterium]